MRARMILLGVAVVAAAAMLASAGTPGSAAGKPRTVTCRAPGKLSGFFHLPKHKVKARATRCAAARKLALKFSASCLRAYVGQGTCKARSQGRRWRCRSRIVGPLAKGAPSKETCRSKRARVTFVVTFVLPEEPTSFPAAALMATPYNDKRNCVDTSNPGTVLPPPAGGGFEIHLFGGTAPAVGNGLQSALVAHKVALTLHAGLGSLPNPNPISIFLTPKEFDSDGNFGIAAQTCADRNKQALVVRANQDDLASTTAHELFHAHAFWAIAKAAVAVPWWEEASATWSESKVGFPEVAIYDVALQYPYTPLDDANGTHKYAMSRFVEFLDDHSLIEDPAWNFQREIIRGYKSPGATKALAAAIERRLRTPNPFGELLAEFWGDRLKAKPSHGQQLKPTGQNSIEIQVNPGPRVLDQPAAALRTALIDFKLSPKVQRVEFEFEPRAGYFWGLVKPNESRRFRGAESVSFCVGGADQDDLEWPGHFPVTFTNGTIGGGEIKGKITIRAQSDPEQCTAPTGNRACRLLKRARVKDVLGDGIFPFASDSEDAHVHHWLCFYEGSGTEARLDLARHKTDTIKKVRETVKQIVAQLNLDPIEIGDVGGIGQIDAGDKVTGVLVFSVKREIALLMVGPGAHRADLITLGKRMAGELD
jgi:hypothetical protein